MNKQVHVYSKMQKPEINFRLFAVPLKETNHGRFFLFKLFSIKVHKTNWDVKVSSIINQVSLMFSFPGHYITGQ